MDRDIKKIKIADKARSFKWINSKFEEGRLFINGSLPNKTSFNKFRLFIKYTEEIYSGNWDLEITKHHLEGTWGYNIAGIIIYFESIEMSNSNKSKHIIEELFVKIIISLAGSEIKIRNIYGGRTKISYAEFVFGYFHSHLSQSFKTNSTAEAPMWGSFCTGSGHINEYLADINSEGSSKKLLTSFLVQIIGLINWESLEGTPYKRFEAITISPTSGRRSSPSATITSNIYEKILTNHIDNKTIPNIEFSYETGGYKIVDNEKFDDFITKNSSLSESEKNYLLCMKSSNGEYFQKGGVPGFPPIPIVEKIYIFQGREIPFKIGAKPAELETDSLIEYFIHPTIKTQIKNKIENDINKNKIRQSTIDRYEVKTSDATKSTKSD